MAYRLSQLFNFFILKNSQKRKKDIHTYILFVIKLHYTKKIELAFLILLCN